SDTMLTENTFVVPTPRMSPDEWIALHEKTHQYFWGPTDSRIPGFLPELAQAVCTLRLSLSQLRVAFEQHPQPFLSFRERMLQERKGLHGSDPQGHLVRLFDSHLSRIDWREQDVLEMILEYLTSTTHDNPVLSEELARFQALREENWPVYENTVRGLISEARGNLMGLTYARYALKVLSERFDRLNVKVLQLLVQSLAHSMGLTVSGEAIPDHTRLEPAACWNMMYSSSQDYWAEQGARLPLKPFEKGSLFLLEALPIRSKGHSGFVRYLIEHEEAYRRLLSTCYAPATVQRERLQQEMDRYNRLPEYSTRKVSYSEEEHQHFLYAFMLRPDVVAAIAEREEHKDIYHVIAGLGSKARLPRVLQEVQNIFGYVTPEAFQKIVEILALDPTEIIRVIASYKQYSADPGGDIIIYICKGTACFLRGQPDLSRRLAAEIEAEEGEIGRHGIQFIEMDCFGVCHLAPVIKARDTFLGKRTVEDIPRTLEQLLKGPQYENRIMFLNRIREILAPGHESDLLEKVRISHIIQDGGFPPAQKRAREKLNVSGHHLRIDASGQVFACQNGTRRPLGQFVPSSLAFLYTAPDGTEQTACVILDAASQIESFVNYPAAFLEKELCQSLKPRARVVDGSVWVERTGGSLHLGLYDANAIAVRREGGTHLLICLSGPPSQAPPMKEEGLSETQPQKEDESFIKDQDRLVLGFASGGLPGNDIVSYIANGGYASIHRVLGLSGEPAWSTRDIIKVVSEANLRGRGGAGFPTGRKWDAVRLAKCVVEEKDRNRDEIKLIVANGDEGDPGAFMDRTLIQEQPHQVIEGMLLAAIAADARYGVIYVRKEYEDAVRRLEHALFQARRKGFLGTDIFGVCGRHFDIDIRLGAGAFVAGEKRAIMRAIEGEPAEPTFGAVSNTFRGLWGKPTLLNNVETFANVPLIIQRGGKWYARQGTERSGGSKIFSVAGIVNQTGLVEVRFGRTLYDIIQICRGIQEGKGLAGVQIGGPSGAILSLTGVRSYLLHTPLDFDTFDSVGAMLGSGGLVFIGEDDDVV
ncbi:MAG: NAD(P)H-dependent oxidoreductase subunit E, partial [Desulforhabdus sp.]|nr:NAD(P)H-dependent oxidoreductase subunit E [Desulforhabdus sp.]